MSAKKINRSAKSTGKNANAKAAKTETAAKLNRTTMVDLYQASEYLPLGLKKKFGLRMPVLVYFKDPAVAKKYPSVGIDPEFTTPWEPGLRSGPTSARFAVVDYDSTKNKLTAPAVWNRTQSCFRGPGRKPLDRNAIELFQFHQLSVWATLQNALDYFESGFGLGRRITWAFEGNRLIVLPHAGYGENAYYDRASKSLQFYYFDGQHGTIYTCLSSDIVNHEFGHAVLDGMRPYYYESVRGETAAFHEFLGDLTAILMAFRNNAFRRLVLATTKGNLDDDDILTNLAQEFGEAITGNAYLRSALNEKDMEELAGNLEPHALSEVLTGAMFDILKGVYAKEQETNRKDRRGKSRKPTDVEALAATVPWLQTLAIQPLDLLPPCSVTFRDYALAVLRSQQVANPTDPKGFRAMMVDVFVEKRGILLHADKAKLLEPVAVFTRPRLDVFHPIESIASSRGGAYRFLDDNRNKLFIPLNADLVVSEVVVAHKLARDGQALPDQIIVQYIWREDVPLEGTRFGRFDGERTSMLCGATLVLDENGNQIHWARKPGSTSLGKRSDQLVEQQDGKERRAELLDTIEARIADGTIGETISGELGMVQRATPPFTVHKVDGSIRFQLAPHFSICANSQDTDTGDGQWQISF